MGGMGGMGGGSMGSESIGGNMGGSVPYSHPRGSSGPFVTTTTTTTVTDLSTGMTRAYHSSSPYGGSDRTNWGGVFGGEKKFLEGLGLHNVLNENDLEVLKSSWNTLKKRGDFAPKVFIRYNFTFCQQT